MSSSLPNICEKIVSIEKIEKTAIKERKEKREREITHFSVSHLFFARERNAPRCSRLYRAPKVEPEDEIESRERSLTCALV